MTNVLGVIISIIIGIFLIVWIVHDICEAMKFRDDEDQEFWNKLTK